jgi:pimeloyl-ACP methyl ester carboxylesterase
MPDSEEAVMSAMSAQHYVDRQGRGPTIDGLRGRLLAGLPVTDRRLEVAGVSTAVLEGGHGPPVVFLQTEFAAVWIRVIPELVRTHRVIAADLPGLGASHVADSAPSVDSVLTWVGELIDRTCPTPPALVGKGAAGAIAARFAVDHSDRLQALVLVDSYGLARYRPPLGMVLTFAGVVLRPTERGLERGFRNYCFADLDGLRGEMGERWDAMAAYALDRFRTPTVRAAMRRLMRPLASAIPPHDLARITVPTTLIWGRHDRGVRLNVARDASERYGWPLHVIEDARDDPAIEQPQAFLEALRTALDND